MTTINYMLTYLFFVSLPALAFALLDHIVFGMISAISNIDNPFVPKARNKDVADYDFNNINSIRKYLRAVHDDKWE